MTWDSIRSERLSYLLGGIEGWLIGTGKTCSEVSAMRHGLEQAWIKAYPKAAKIYLEGLDREVSHGCGAICGTDGFCFGCAENMADELDMWRERWKRIESMVSLDQIEQVIAIKRDLPLPTSSS